MPCVEDLRALVREARARGNARVEIIAVSDRKVDDRAKALKYLGVTETDGFHLLIDEKHASFSAFGCGSGPETRHGLFLVDGNGMVQSRYMGETPFGDSGEVFDRIRLIAGVAKANAKTADHPTPKPATDAKSNADPVARNAPAPTTRLGGGGSGD